MYQIYKCSKKGRRTNFKFLNAKISKNSKNKAKNVNEFDVFGQITCKNDVENAKKNLLK